MTEMTDIEIRQAAEEAAKTPPAPVPGAEGLPTDVRDGVAGEPEPGETGQPSADADDGSAAHEEHA